MENSQTDHSANELKVVKMLGVDARVGINLQGIIIVGGIFEETVERIEHFVGEEEEKFTVAISCERATPGAKRLTEKDRRSPDRLHRQT